MIFNSNRARRLKSIDSFELDDGGFSALSNGGGAFGGGGGGAGVPATAAPVPPIDFDFDLSQIQTAIMRGNTRADVLSAYEVFTTGTSQGRGLGYAQDVQRRFGAPSLRHAAASYLDAAGLPRLAQIVSPDPTPTPTPVLPPLEDVLGDFFELPVPDNWQPGPSVTTPPATTPKTPVELLLDALPALFGQATYNPPLQSQATGYTPISGDFGAQAGASAGGGIGLWLILGAVAIAGYFLYKRFSG